MKNKTKEQIQLELNKWLYEYYNMIYSIARKDKK